MMMSKDLKSQPMLYASSRVLIALSAFVVLSIAFAKLALEIREPQVPRFDQPVLLAVHNYASPWLDQLALTATNIGSPPVMILVAIILAVFWWRRRDRRAAVMMVGSAIGALIVNVVLKLSFERTRPSLWEHIVSETTFSFPSTHAMISMVIAATLMVLLWRTRWRMASIIFGSVAVIVIGATRIYLGVHYPSDILGGWIVGAAWVLVVMLVLRLPRQLLTAADASTQS